MENKKNKITIDFGSNPQLAEVFVDKKPGQKVKISVEFSIDEINNESVVGSIKTIVGSKSGEIKPEYKSPVMILMSSKKSDQPSDDSDEYGL